jgi:hypothetical protein
MSSALKELIQPGKELGHLLMRSILHDDRKANAFIMHLNYCDELGCTDKKTMLFNWLAIQVSVKGRGRLDLVRSIIGAWESEKGRRTLGQVTQGKYENKLE